MSVSVGVSWVIAASAVVVVGAVGAGIGISGLISAPEVEGPYASGLIENRSVSAYACIDGPRVTELTAGDRVLVVARSVDGEWLAVRNPAQLGQSVWMPRAVITLDDDQVDAATSVPVGGACPTVTVVTDAAAEPEPSVDSPDSPADPSAPGSGPAPDTAAPTLSGAGAQPPTVGCSTDYNPVTSTLISVNAVDNVGVTGVTISWSGSSYTGQSSAARSGSVWSTTFDATPEPGGNGPVTFVITARDAAGNVSSAATVVVNVECQI